MQPDLNMALLKQQPAHVSLSKARRTCACSRKAKRKMARCRSAMSLPNGRRDKTRCLKSHREARIWKAIEDQQRCTQRLTETDEPRSEQRCAFKAQMRNSTTNNKGGDLGEKNVAALARPLEVCSLPFVFKRRGDISEVALSFLFLRMFDSLVSRAGPACERRLHFCGGSRSKCAFVKRHASPLMFKFV